MLDVGIIAVSTLQMRKQSPQVGGSIMIKKRGFWDQTL